MYNRINATACVVIDGLALTPTAALPGSSMNLLMCATRLMKWNVGLSSQSWPHRLITVLSVDTDKFKGRASFLPKIEPTRRHSCMGRSRSAHFHPRISRVVPLDVRRVLIPHPARQCLQILCPSPSWRGIHGSRHLLPMIIDSIASISGVLSECNCRLASKTI